MKPKESELINELILLRALYINGDITKRVYSNKFKTLLEYKKYPNEIITKTGISKHKSIYVKEFGPDCGRCKICNSNTKFISLENGFHEFCGNSCKEINSLTNDKESIIRIIEIIESKKSSLELCDLNVVLKNKGILYNLKSKSELLKDV